MYSIHNQIKDTSNQLNKDYSNSVIDVGSKKVRGIGLNFLIIDGTQIRKAGLGRKANPKEDISDGQLDTEDYKLADPIIPFLIFDLIKWIFIQQWQIMENTFQKLKADIKI